jgi:hypothetical protein
MVSVLKAEWIRSIRSWRFWVAVASALGLLLFTAGQYWQSTTGSPIPHNANFFSVSIAALGGYVDALWPVLIPVIATLPAGDTLAIDRRRGVDMLMITRVGWSRYLWGKLVGTVMIAVVAVGVAIGATVTLYAGWFPPVLPRLLGWNFGPKYYSLPYHVKQSGVFATSYLVQYHLHLFWTAPTLYVVLVIAEALWATVCLASLSSAGAVWIRQPLITLAVPVIVFFLGDVIAQALWHNFFIPSVYAGAYLSGFSAPPWALLAVYWAVWLLVPILILWWVGARQKEWPRSVG